ncbi:MULTISPECIES: poly(ADP-ribose) glycohydrolase domain-containing protein [unclassified Chamaesiphon]|uniref:poly(ADP-ribose) glycohydrolase domain-containing protein n=1 Tax=unclassified Chamaesiphon TaxID=2620921 RepID=UPI00286A6BF3|nr:MULTISPECIES: poly(ADP-ribose) glycohydrolase domain-containing protein [unclassified Chamaesiphon]
MSLKNTAKETLEILTTGTYTNKSGTVVEFLAAQQMAVKKTVLYSPQHSAALLAAPAASTAERPTIEVTAETTQVAAHRLVQTEKCRERFRS